MAVERHRRFQPQRVARSQAARPDAEFAARVQDGVPDPLRLGRIEVDLETVLARVARPCDARRRSGRLGVDEVVIANRRQVDGGELLESRQRPGPLDGDLRVAVAGVIHLRLPAVGVPDVLVVLLLVRRVHAQEEPVRRDAVHQDVVDEAAVLVKQACVLNRAVREARRRVCGNVIDQREGFRAADLDFAHVADVEDSGGLPDGMVLV